MYANVSILTYVNMNCENSAQKTGMKRLVIVFAVTLGVMLAIFRFAGWRAEHALLARYCAAPAATIGHVNEILEKGGPDAGEKRRPYIIAAKLIFLVPQESDEPLEAYLARLRQRIDTRCSQRF